MALDGPACISKRYSDLQTEFVRNKDETDWW